MTTKAGRFIWYELMTTDVDAAAAFYGAVVGWTSVRMGQEGMDYRRWDADGSGIGGMMALPPGPGMAPVWVGYVEVPDVDAAELAVTAAGGAVWRSAWDVPEAGRMAMVADPQGAGFYVMTPNGSPAAIPPYSPAHLGHCAWNELHAREGAAALDFYADLFGWTRAGAMDEWPGGPYRFFSFDQEPPAGGVTANTDRERPIWLFYFHVADIDAARERVLAEGGAVISGPNPIPGGGWILEGRDPQGAIFALTGPKAG